MRKPLTWILVLIAVLAPGCGLGHNPDIPLLGDGDGNIGDGDGDGDGDINVGDGDGDGIPGDGDGDGDMDGTGGSLGGSPLIAPTAGATMGGAGGAP